MHEKHPHHGHKPEDKKPADVSTLDEAVAVPPPGDDEGGPHGPPPPPPTGA